MKTRHTMNVFCKWLALVLIQNLIDLFVNVFVLINETLNIVLLPLTRHNQLDIFAIQDLLLSISSDSSSE